MKKVLISITAGILIGILITVLIAGSVFYPKFGMVFEVNYDTDTVIVEDSLGFLWEFSGAEDWCVGDNCAMIMYTGFTKRIYDDAIVRCRYCL